MKRDTDGFIVRFRKTQTKERMRLKGFNSCYGIKFVAEVGNPGSDDFQKRTLRKGEMEEHLHSLFENSPKNRRVQLECLDALEWILRKVANM